MSIPMKRTPNLWKHSLHEGPEVRVPNIFWPLGPTWTSKVWPKRMDPILPIVTIVFIFGNRAIILGSFGDPGTSLFIRYFDPPGRFASVQGLKLDLEAWGLTVTGACQSVHGDTADDFKFLLSLYTKNHRSHCHCGIIYTHMLVHAGFVPSAYDAQNPSLP